MALVTMYLRDKCAGLKVTAVSAPRGSALSIDVLVQYIDRADVFWTLDTSASFVSCTEGVGAS